MLGINSSISSFRPQIPSFFFVFRISKPNLPLLQPRTNLHPVRTLNFRIRRNPRPTFLGFAGNANNNGGREENLRKDPKGNTGSNGAGDGDSKNGRRPIFNLKLGDLLDPDPDNVVAVGLTCVLTWASVQVLSQLFLISAAILVAALKYSFIAALLLFILIALL
ncbi:hypothetical protein CRG98_015896 [Punica granatum]|uniref:Transmembrane protein n=1 Tax=Punica granatum TaxID=22663 RepID=A0A2I0K7P3_PUNGR|nr:hypothetical protein CRG98_015896 [Punica granatum]